MSMKSRVLAAVGGVGLTLAVAVTAVTAGGPLSGLAAPAWRARVLRRGVEFLGDDDYDDDRISAAFAFGGVGGFGGWRRCAEWGDVRYERAGGWHGRPGEVPGCRASGRELRA
ncbi:MAG: hypothetical protein U0232_15725 [Thermomicrobiales bacterium]